VSIAVRLAVAEDMKTVIDLSYRIWPVCYAGILTPEQIQNLLMRIYDEETLREDARAGHLYFLAWDEKEAVGYASGYKEGNAVRLKKLYVLPECQGQGVGQCLTDAVIRAFADAEEMRLYVNCDNTPAQRYYERRGFVRMGEAPVKMGDFHFTDFIYAKALT